MDRDRKAGMTPEEGVNALNSVIGEVVEISSNGDLDAFAAVFAKMEEIVAATGADVPEFDEKIDMLRQMTALGQASVDEMDAALWAGDYARAQTLMSGCELTEGLEFDAENEEAVELTFDLSDLTEALGGAEIADPMPDVYADLAQGLPGAAQALISAGTDLNTPSGDAMHTAILAALDAPGRNAKTIVALIEAGADASVIHTQEGDNAFSWSMGYPHGETVSDDSELKLFAVLSSEGVDPDYVVPEQMAVLHRGILQDSQVQVEALLTIGANPDVCLPDTFEPGKLAGATPLMLAGPKPQMMRLLLDHGSDGTVPDARGRDQLAFLEEEAQAAALRATPEDAWTVAHAEALQQSVALLRAHLSR